MAHLRSKGNPENILNCINSTFASNCATVVTIEDPRFPTRTESITGHAANDISQRLKNHGPIILFASDPLMVYACNALSSGENVQLHLDLPIRSRTQDESASCDARICNRPSHTPGDGRGAWEQKFRNSPPSTTATLFKSLTEGSPPCDA